MFRRVLCRLAQGSFQRVVADQWLHVFFARALACFRVQDAGTALVDYVEAFSFVQNCRTFLECCSVSDDLSSAVRLEDCHRSSLCTVLHRQGRPRCISHLAVDSLVTSIASFELDISPRTEVSQRFTKHSEQRQLLLEVHHFEYWMQNCSRRSKQPNQNQ